MKIKIYNNIFKLKKHWNLIQPNEYNAFSLWKMIWLRSPIYLLPQKSRMIFIEVLDQNVPVLIIPICKKLDQNSYFSFSRFNGTFKFDFIYNPDVLQNKLVEYVNFAFDNIQVDKIVFDKVKENSYTRLALLNIDNLKFEEKTVPAVSIDNICEYEEWYNSLSKNSRQNIRTAYNRLNRDGHIIEFEFFQNQKLPKNQLSDLVDLYCDRHIKRYNLKVNFLKRFYLKHIDFSTLFLQNSNKNFYALLKFDNKLVAFMAGILENNSFRVPRLSINDDFSIYSPGVILINETIKNLSTQYTKINIDLGIGDEKYKKSMGGTEYNMVHIESVR